MVCHQGCIEKQWLSLLLQDQTVPFRQADSTMDSAAGTNADLVGGSNTCSNIPNGQPRPLLSSEFGVNVSRKTELQARVKGKTSIPEARDSHTLEAQAQGMSSYVADMIKC